MITLGDRVKEAIDDFSQKRFELALQHAAIAIDLTAKRHFKSSKSSGSNYKKLLKEYSWLMELMAFNGVNLDESKFGNYPLDGIPEPSFQDLIYHVVRCNLVHDEGVPNNFQFSEGNILTLSKGNIVLPEKLIWGLLAIVVFCQANSDQQTSDGYWLGVYENRFEINDFWGKEEVIRAIHERREPIRVSIIVPAGHMV